MINRRLRLILFALLLTSVAPVLAQAAPDAVVSQFLDNWRVANYDGMYNQIAQASKDLTTFPVFETTYTNAETAISIADMSYEIHDVVIQGSSAAVHYDLHIDSAIFGTLDDPGRIMRLVQSPAGWRVAWSPMDIFDGMTASSQLRSVGQREARANIYDRNGLPLVEQGGTVVTLYVQRQAMSGEDECLDLLASLLRRQRKDLADFFNTYNPDTLFYAGELDLDVYQARQDDLSSICGVTTTVERQTRRYYRGNAVSHVTGYIGQIPADEVADWESKGYSSDELIGRNGIERAYEQELSGQPTRSLQITEPGGVVLREFGSTEGVPPTSVSLTIDRELQLDVAQALADAYTYGEGNWGARSVSTGAAAVVMDVNTGAILAMSSYPSFDPDVFNTDTQCCTFLTAGDYIQGLLSDLRQPLLNRVTQSQYSPGSTFKIVTTTAAAAEQLMTPTETFDCTLTWDGSKYGDDVGFERVDWRYTDGLDPTGPVTMSQALTASCDPFFYQMGARLYGEVGPSTLADFARMMGFGSPTGIGYYGPEAAGSIIVPDAVSQAINDAIGQGDVQVSPIQMVRMIAAVANGGTVYKPYLVQQVGGVDGQAVSFQAEPEIVDQMDVPPEVLRIVREGMCEVTTNKDLGTAVDSFGNASYHACGKTGTAQTDRYPNAWFVAYAPSDNPQIAVVVIAEQSREGADVAAPIVRRIMDYYFDAPVVDYPAWWHNLEYIPVDIPEGATGG